MCTCYTGTPWRGRPRLPVPNCMQIRSVHAGCRVLSVTHTKEMREYRSDSVFRTEATADSSFPSLSAAVENQALRTRQMWTAQLSCPWADNSGSSGSTPSHGFLNSPSSLPRCCDVEFENVDILNPHSLQFPSLRLGQGHTDSPLLH